MSRVRRNYELRRFSRSDDRNFQAAIKLYNRTITGSFRTNSNEISYWLENYGKYSPDQFCVCGFYSDGQLAGYAEFAYFKVERIVAVDYILLHEHHRNNGEYFQFSGMLQGWIDEQGWAVDFYVAEVAKDSSITPTGKATLVDLFHWMGFAVVDCDYIQPSLRDDDLVTDVRSHFMIRSSEPRTSISSSLFSSIVKTLFFKHYGRWFSDFVADKGAYLKMLESRFETLRSEAERKGDVELNGVKEVASLLPAPSPQELTPTPLSHSLIVSSSIMVICGTLLAFLDVFHRDARTVLSFVGASLLISAVSFTLFYRRGPWLLRQVMSFIRPSRASRRKKSRSSSKS